MGGRLRDGARAPGTGSSTRSSAWPRVVRGCFRGAGPRGWGRRPGGWPAACSASAAGSRERTSRAPSRNALPPGAPGWPGRATATWGRAAATTFRLARLAPAEIVALSRVEGWELLAEPVARGEGAILVTGHIGNWEVGGRGPWRAAAFRWTWWCAPRTIHSSTVHWCGPRRRLGMNVVSREDPVHVLLRLLRKGRIVVLLADQNAHAGGLMVDFFGEAASTARGAALLSLRSGAPLVLGVALHHPRRPRSPSPRSRTGLHFTERCAGPGRGSADASARRGPRALGAALPGPVSLATPAVAPHASRRAGAGTVTPRSGISASLLSQPPVVLVGPDLATPNGRTRAHGVQLGLHLHTRSQRREHHRRASLEDPAGHGRLRARLRDSGARRRLQRRHALAAVELPARRTARGPLRQEAHGLFGGH